MIVGEGRERKRLRMRRRGEGVTLLVGVDVGANSRELLTWVLMKVAQAGDHVIVVHVLPSAPANSAPSFKEQAAVDYYLTRPLHANIYDVYESLCRFKQIDFQVKISHGAGVRKVLATEASLFNARKLIIGKGKHNALGHSKSLATYCAKRVPSSCSVVIVDNGTVIIEKVGTQPIQGLTIAESKPIITLGTGAKGKTPRGPLLNNGLKDPWSIAENNSDAAVTSSNNNCYLCRPAIVPIQMEAFKVCLPLKPACMFCSSNVRVRDEEKNDLEYESYSSCDSFRTVSSTSCPQKEEDTEIPSNKPKEFEDSAIGEACQRENSSPGWPLLKSPVTVNKVCTPRSVAREMSVVEWALKLPDRRRQTTGDIPRKTDISQEDFHSQLQASKAENLTQGHHTVLERPYTTESVSREDNSLVQRLQHLCKSRNCIQFTYQELQSATFGFSAEHLIGKGGWSNVYRGVLSDGQSVAVKSLNPSPEAEQELLVEVEITTTLKHKNIISLIGYCIEEHKYLLVYNLLLRGSLEENLYGGKDRPLVPWTERLKVAIGVAEALNFLHDGCPRPIIHRDVKSSNILLSEDYEPQLADFGLAKWASNTSAYITCSDVVGTFGYLAPEYFMYGKVNEKTDVYSFGIVLLELITGRKPIDSTNPKGQESLVLWARPLLGDGAIKDLVDPLLEDTYDTNELKRMILGAALCIRQSSQFRPRMSRILKLLQGGGDDLTYWSKRQVTIAEDGDELVEDEYETNYGGCDIQTHLNLAMLGVDDDMASVSSPDQSVDLVHAHKSLEDYLQGRYSRSSSFD